MTLLAVMIVAACGDDGGGGGPTEPNGELAGAMTARWARFANLSPAAGPLDVCFETATGVFEGPILAAAGHTGGLAVGEVSQYVPVPETTVTGQGDRRFVVGGSGSCATAHPMLVDERAYEGNTPLGHHTTFVVFNTTSGVAQVGGGSTDFHDLMNHNPGPMLMRHHADGIAMIDVGIMLATGFERLKSGIGVGSLGGFTSMEANTLANGWFVYLRGPVMDVELGIRMTGVLDPAVAPELTVTGIDLAAGTAWTLFTAGHAGDAADPLRFIACDDYFRRGALTACLE